MRRENSASVCQSARGVAKTVDHDQHLLHFRPVPVQRHRIAARGPGIAETDHAADVGEPERRVDDRQREDHVLAGVHRAILSQDDVGRNAARDHCAGDDLAFRQIRSRRHAAAHDRPAEIPLAPQPAGFSTRSSTSSRVPNTNSRSAGRSGVSIRCRALIAAISASVGDRVGRGRHGNSSAIGNAAQSAAPCRASRNHVSCRLIAKPATAAMSREVRRTNSCAAGCA